MEFVFSNLFPICLFEFRRIDRPFVEDFFSVDDEARVNNVKYRQMLKITWKKEGYLGVKKEPTPPPIEPVRWPICDVYHFQSCRRPSKPRTADQSHSATLANKPPVLQSSVLLGQSLSGSEPAWKRLKFHTENFLPFPQRGTGKTSTRTALGTISGAKPFTDHKFCCSISNLFMKFFCSTCQRSCR